MMNEKCKVNYYYAQVLLYYISIDSRLSSFIRLYPYSLRGLPLVEGESLDPIALGGLSSLDPVGIVQDRPWEC